MLWRWATTTVDVSAKMSLADGGDTATIGEGSVGESRVPFCRLLNVGRRTMPTVAAFRRAAMVEEADKRRQRQWRRFSNARRKSGLKIW